MYEIGVVVKAQENGQDLMNLSLKRGADVRALIKSEDVFFSHSFVEQGNLTPERIGRFRTETIAERRLRLSNEMIETLQGRVAHGPFKGLHLDPVPGWGSMDLCSMLLGTYEIEVMEALHSSELAHCSHLVNIGAADGYYAVGGLYNGRFETADCFELTKAGRQTIKRNADHNGVVDKIRIFGEAGSDFPNMIGDVDWAQTILLCDIEGAEFELLDEDCLDRLSKSTILIEVHNWVEDFQSKYHNLLERVASRFNIKLLERSALPAHFLPELRGYPDDNRLLMLSEGRPNIMRFLLLSN